MFFLMWPPLVRRHLSDHLLWSIFQSSLYILHLTSHAGPFCVGSFIGRLGKGSWTFKPTPSYLRIWAPSNEHKVYKVSMYLNFRCRTIEEHQALLESATQCYRDELAMTNSRVTEARKHSDREQLLQEASCILAANLVILICSCTGCDS